MRIKLTQEERDVLQGKYGPAMQKVMQTVVLYGEALGAERLADIEGAGHFVISWATPGIAPPLEMLDELVEAGLKTRHPFTLDPGAPLDFENLSLRQEQEQLLLQMYRGQSRYDERMQQLGLRDAHAYTCSPCLPEVGNIPARNTVLAWSESCCVVFANSVLGARSNRHGAIIDLLCNIAGKTPLVGLLTDEGRRATWLVEVRTSTLPHPQLLGAAIGRQVVEDVPFIVGLDRFLGPGLGEATLDYLREMGAACATYGAVGLFHVEHITPEAVEQGRSILAPGHASMVIDDDRLRELAASFPLLWPAEKARPERCYIGCPHLSLRQLRWWAENIHSASDSMGRRQLAVDTVMFAAPQVIEQFKAEARSYQQLVGAGVKLSASCPETLFEGGVSEGDAVVTNSSKLQAYTAARFFPDEELVEILVTGEVDSLRYP